MSRRLLGAVLLLVAGVAAVLGTFLPLFRQGHAGDGGFMAVVSSWRTAYLNVPQGLDLDAFQSPRFGVPIVVAGVLLVVAAALVFLPESQRLAARYLGVGATGVLVGSVAATGSYVASLLGRTRPPEDPGAYVEDVGEGTWMLVAAAVGAVVGVVLIHSRRVVPVAGTVVYRVDDDGDEDMDTPPFGIPVSEIPVAEIPVVEVAQIPETGYERPAEGPDHPR
ncbi:hypothetical protein F4560_004566 [Saccharothrix ecbatanensis]|uniref:Uncharacterized protein n=1 Tax=Saccharothrix ecbatanensis TaxID=1105145 RepID=A0A7W9HM16_9PSEU|nr:hypothetical protein [Saccharothrix ecbatanensis]MBB5804798.1 hypothetical protein [Saccharothrix ecbatanensis]